jgi:hypothetical protein
VPFGTDWNQLSNALVTSVEQSAAIPPGTGVPTGAGEEVGVVVGDGEGDGVGLSVPALGAGVTVLVGAAVGAAVVVGAAVGAGLHLGRSGLRAHTSGAAEAAGRVPALPHAMTPITDRAAARAHAV